MAAKKTLSPDEIAERTAVLRRFRELLQAQRDRFRSYLDVLERQKDTIEKSDAADLIKYVELEEKIVADIHSIQKVIDPMEDLYRAVSGSPVKQTEKDEVADIKNTLDDLKKEAVVRSQRNRDLLSKRIIELRTEIESLRGNPYGRQRAVYSGAPSVVDIRG